MRSRTLCAIVLPTTQQQREEHREQDPAHDQADVADLLDEADVEILLGLGLGLVRGVLEHAHRWSCDDRRPASASGASFRMKKLARPLPNCVGLVEVVVIDETCLVCFFQFLDPCRRRCRPGRRPRPCCRSSADRCWRTAGSCWPTFQPYLSATSLPAIMAVRVSGEGLPLLFRHHPLGIHVAIAQRIDREREDRVFSCQTPPNHCE